MPRSYTSGKLIWPEIWPLPFESSWSLMAKILKFNAMTPLDLANLIAKDEKQKYLDFRDSTWIDFEKLSQVLGVSITRLRSCFAADLGFPVMRSGAIKFCPLCKDHQYHNILFEIDFVAICPWHRKSLESCTSCFNAIVRTGLRKNLVEGNHGPWAKWSSSCKHVVLDDAAPRISKLEHELSLQIMDISTQMISWWNVALNDSGFKTMRASKTRYSKDPQPLDMLLNRAEAIAGKCPIDLEYERFEVVNLEWTHKALPRELDTSIDTDRSSQYRSVRRYLFKTFLAEHKACWLKLIHYHPYDLLELNRSTCCEPALAFAIWRMRNEGLEELEELTSQGKNKSPVKHLDSDDRAYVNMIYAEFFTIWAQIHYSSKHSKIEIVVDPELGIFSSLAVLKPFLPGHCIVSPHFLNKVSRKCLIHKKQEDSMRLPIFNDSWFASINYANDRRRNVHFKLRKEISRKHFSNQLRF
jgi:hypothetical protein